MKTVDYLLHGGRVIDPYRNLDTVADIAVSNGVIVSSNDVRPKQTIDVSGCIVTPGLIDYHTHVAHRMTDLGVEPDVSYLPMGVTTVVDAGSTGTANYEAFRAMTLGKQVRVKAFLNVCPVGLATEAYHENLNPAVYQQEKMLRFLNQYSDQLLGVKIRASANIVGEYGVAALDRALEIAAAAKRPIVVHTTDPVIPPEELAAKLRPGDIYAHIYQGKGDTVVRNGHVIPEMFGHQKRGVIYDAANGNNHFSFKVARTCLENGLLPDVISTDLTMKSLYVPGKVCSLPFVLSKYIALGLQLPEIIRRATTVPARLLGEEKELGSLCEGTCADIAVLRKVSKPVSYSDFSDEVLHGDCLLRPEMTIRNGSVVFRQIDF